MIKLIACDMDGTLLDSKSHLPRDLFDVLAALRARGVYFCVASGRQYPALRRDFEAVAQDIVFICENGANVMYREQRLLLDPIPSHFLPAIIEAARAIPHTHAILCCAEVALIERTAPLDLITNTVNCYPSVRVVDDLMAYADAQDVCKVAFYDEGDAQHGAMPMMESLLPEGLSIILSGGHWVDVMKPGVDKGRAMRALQAMYGIRKDECMAFGDYLNDAELLESVTHSYAMANAHPQLKDMAAHIAPSNDENGVMRTIRSVVLEEQA